MHSFTYTLVLWKLLFSRGAFFYVALNFWCFLKTVFGKYDIACAVDVDTLAGVWLGAKIRGKPVVVDLHEWMSEVPEVVNRPRIQDVWRWIEKTLIPKTNTQITVGEALAEAYYQSISVKPKVIYNMPLRQVRDKAYTKTVGKKLLYQGALNEGRGLEALIQAMDFLPDYELHILGNGDLELDCFSWCRSSNRASLIHSSRLPRF
jgi:glycosyltransferase involved in cell wall biosynthesis